MKCAIFKYKASTLLLIYYFWHINNILQLASICNTLIVLNDSQKLKNKSAQLLIYGSNFIPNITLQLLLWAIPVYTFFQVSPQEEIRDPEVRRPYRPWDTRHTKMLFIAH